MNKKDYALKMVRIPRGRSGHLANEEVFFVFERGREGEGCTHVFCVIVVGPLATHP